MQLPSKNIQKNSLTNKSSWLANFSAVPRKIASVVRYVFLQKIHWLSLIIFVLVAVASLTLIFYFLFYSADDNNPSQVSSQPRLTTEAVDHLELWIESRQANYQKKIEIPPNVFKSSN